MRTGVIGSLAYQPADPPNNPADLQRYLRDELFRIAAALQLVALGHLDDTTVAPTKPRAGDIRFTAGTWDPGSGAGVYAYYDAGSGLAWNKLG